MPINEGNRFGFVYDGAIEDNVPGAVNVRAVSYKSNNEEIGRASCRERV